MKRTINQSSLGAARLWTSVLLLAAAPSSLASAADITSETLGDGRAVILVIGEIKPGDEEKFRELTLKNPKAAVAFDSPGGALVPALEMGRMISLRGYPTVVLDKSLCASACALMWLAGSQRFLEPGGRLGFHASYRTIDGRQIESGVGNALIGHYLSQINLSQRTVIFASSASPREITWLTEQNRVESGIQFETIVLGRGAGTSDAPATIQLAAPKPAIARDSPCGPITSELCLPALTQLVVRIEAGLSSRTTKTGETFPLTLAEPLVIDRQVVLPAGIRGQGEVVHAKGTGLGVGGELVIAARFLEVDGRQMRLRSMRVGVHGKDQQDLTFAAAAVIGLPAMFIRGKHIEIPAGTLAGVKTAQPFAVAAPAAQTALPVPAPPSEGKPK
jgi:hypothetical protein